MRAFHFLLLVKRENVIKFMRVMQTKFNSLIKLVLNCLLLIHRCLFSVDFQRLNIFYVNKQFNYKITSSRILVILHILQIELLVIL